MRAERALIVRAVHRSRHQPNERAPSERGPVFSGPSVGLPRLDPVAHDDSLCMCVFQFMYLCRSICICEWLCLTNKCKTIASPFFGHYASLYALRRALRLRIRSHPTYTHAYTHCVVLLCAQEGRGADRRFGTYQLLYL